MALAGWGASVAGTMPGLRTLTADVLHLTLCFIGSRGVEEIDAIATACGAVADRGSLQLTVSEPVWLPPRRPRALAVRIEDRDRQLAALQRNLAEALEAGGWYRPETRPFVAHVSVARVLRGTRIVRGPLAAPAGSALTASAVTLYRSWLGPGGARYEPLHSVALGGSLAARAG